MLLMNRKIARLMSFITQNSNGSNGAEDKRNPEDYKAHKIDVAMEARAEKCLSNTRKKRLILRRKNKLI